MQGILYEEASVWQFLFITVLLGGWTAWRTGKAVAEGWGNLETVVVYIALLAVGIRFVHHALFGSSMLSFQYFVVDALILLFWAGCGFQFYRTRQMTEKYYWLYMRTTPISWRAK